DAVGVTAEDIWLLVVVGGLVVLLLSLFRKELLMIGFNGAVSEAMGVPVFWLDLLLLVLISLTIVVSLSAVGNILVVAMLVTPAAAARLVTDRVPTMIGLGAAIGGAAGVAGLLASYPPGLPAGGPIVLPAPA